MAQNNWEADKMLDVYIYDYLLKRNLQNSAKAFMAEGKVAADPVAIDAPGGFLFEWWSVFWDIFIARTNEKHSDIAAAYIEAQQVKAREHQQQMQMQQLQIMQQRQAQLQRRDAGHPSFTGSVNGMGSESLLGQSTASVLAAKMYEERMKHPNSMDPESSSQLDANRMALLKSSTNQGQLVQGTPGNLSATLQQIQAQTQQMPDMKGDANLIASQRPLPMDASIYGPRLLHSKAGLGSPGLNEGASGLPLKGWPLTVTGLDQLRPNLGQQKSFIQTPNQFQLLTAQQQHQLLAQAQVHGNIGPAGSANFSDMDPRRFRMSQRSGLNGKDGQSANEGSIGSSIGSPKIRAPSQDQAELLMKMNMDQMQHSSAQQQQSGQLQLQQLQQSNRKRKQHSSSGAVNSTGTGNTAGPSPTSAPSTPSTHTPGDGLPVAGSMHVNSMCRSTIMCGADGPGGLASSSNQLEDMEHFGDGCLEDNVESFLSPHDDADPSLFGTLKRSPMDRSADSSKGFTFLEVGCLRSSTNKVVCCHFSSDGKLLASAGHEKKVVLWNMDTLKTESTPEEHGHLITDIRFKPGSSHLATSSFDRTVRLWNAADPNYCLHVYTGHGSPVMSLDFHPKKTDILCSCEGNGEIRLWSSNQFVCTRVSKHRATAQVRFQPRVGQLLAAADENVVSIFDFEADRRIHALEGHTKEVHSVCWDANGDYLASVSEDSVRVWSLASGGECIHELSSNGNKFHSCVFHPAYPTLLVIGGYQSLELWNMVDNKTMTVAAHEGLIAALAQSPATGMVASASHDKCVKIWK